ncbi:MAG: hypothetical protein ACNA7G_08100, partial [Methylobacter sp.]
SKIVSAMEKGLELGMEKGMEKGMERGKEEEKRIIARSLLDVLDDAVIAERTGLTLEVVRQLRMQWTKHM